MAYDSRVYRILIASPSDVHQERDAAVRVIQDWNNLHSYNRRLVILPLRWETHTAPDYPTRPQEVINRMIVDDCDMLVGVFWTRLGTPTGEADSGTLEEIERVAKAGKPVMLYFSHVPTDPNSVDYKQVEKLKRFRDRVSPNALIETYTSPLEFRDKFANHLEMKIRKLQELDNAGQSAPLDLQFVSLDTTDLAGNSLAATVDMLELSGPDVSLDAELKEIFGQLFQDARIEASVVPIVLAIKNISSTGVRNVYVEMSISALEGTFQLSHVHPARPLRWERASYTVMTSVFVHGNAYADEPSELDRQLEKLTGTGLTKEGEEWRFSFEWDALQPHRVRVVKPVTYLQALGPCKAKFSARVYADSFASPLVLNAEVAVTAQPKPIQTDVLVKKAREIAKARKKAGTFTALQS